MADHVIDGTRIWCDRAPYDVTASREEAELLVAHALKEPDAPPLLYFTMSKNLQTCSLVATKISALEPRVVR